eukprot:jgi/Mesvir1/19406/Mv10436-RA.1
MEATVITRSISGMYGSGGNVAMTEKHVLSTLPVHPQGEGVALEEIGGTDWNAMFSAVMVKDGREIDVLLDVRVEGLRMLRSVVPTSSAGGVGKKAWKEFAFYPMKAVLHCALVNSDMFIILCQEATASISTTMVGGGKTQYNFKAPAYMAKSILLSLEKALRLAVLVKKKDIPEHVVADYVEDIPTDSAPTSEGGARGGKRHKHRDASHALPDAASAQKETSGPDDVPSGYARAFASVRSPPLGRRQSEDGTASSRKSVAEDSGATAPGLSTLFPHPHPHHAPNLLAKRVEEFLHTGLQRQERAGPASTSSAEQLLTNTNSQVSFGSTSVSSSQSGGEAERPSRARTAVRPPGGSSTNLSSSEEEGAGERFEDARSSQGGGDTGPASPSFLSWLKQNRGSKGAPQLAPAPGGQGGAQPPPFHSPPSRSHGRPARSATMNALSPVHSPDGGAPLLSFGIGAPAQQGSGPQGTPSRDTSASSSDAVAESGTGSGARYSSARRVPSGPHPSLSYGASRRLFEPAASSLAGEEGEQGREETGAPGGGRGAHGFQSSAPRGKASSSQDKPEVSGGSMSGSGTWSLSHQGSTSGTRHSGDADDAPAFSHGVYRAASTERAKPVEAILHAATVAGGKKQAASLEVWLTSLRDSSPAVSVSQATMPGSPAGSQAASRGGARTSKGKSRVPPGGGGGEEAASMPKRQASPRGDGRNVSPPKSVSDGRKGSPPRSVSPPRMRGGRTHGTRSERSERSSAGSSPRHEAAEAGRTDGNSSQTSPTGHDAMLLARLQHSGDPLEGHAGASDTSSSGETPLITPRFGEEALAGIAAVVAAESTGAAARKVPALDMAAFQQAREGAGAQQPAQPSPASPSLDLPERHLFVRTRSAKALPPPSGKGATGEAGRENGGGHRQGSGPSSPSDHPGSKGGSSPRMRSKGASAAHGPGGGASASARGRDSPTSADASPTGARVVAATSSGGDTTSAGLALLSRAVPAWRVDDHTGLPPTSRSGSTASTGSARASTAVAASTVGGSTSRGAAVVGLDASALDTTLVVSTVGAAVSTQSTSRPSSVRDNASGWLSPTSGVPGGKHGGARDVGGADAALLVARSAMSFSSWGGGDTVGKASGAGDADTSLGTAAVPPSSVADASGTQHELGMGAPSEYGSATGADEPLGGSELDSILEGSLAGTAVVVRTPRDRYGRPIGRSDLMAWINVPGTGPGSGGDEDDSEDGDFHNADEHLAGGEDEEDSAENGDKYLTSGTGISFHYHTPKTFLLPSPDGSPTQSEGDAAEDHALAGSPRGDSAFPQESDGGSILPKGDNGSNNKGEIDEGGAAGYVLPVPPSSPAWAQASLAPTFSATLEHSLEEGREAGAAASSKGQTGADASRQVPADNTAAGTPRRSKEDAGRTASKGDASTAPASRSPRGDASSAALSGRPGGQAAAPAASLPEGGGRAQGEGKAQREPAQGSGGAPLANPGGSSRAAPGPSPRADPASSMAAAKAGAGAAYAPGLEPGTPVCIHGMPLDGHGGKGGHQGCYLCVGAELSGYLYEGYDYQETLEVAVSPHVPIGGRPRRRLVVPGRSLDGTVGDEELSRRGHRASASVGGGPAGISHGSAGRPESFEGYYPPISLAAYRLTGGGVSSSLDGIAGLKGSSKAAGGSPAGAGVMSQPARTVSLDAAWILSKNDADSEFVEGFAFL